MVLKPGLLLSPPSMLAPAASLDPLGVVVFLSALQTSQVDALESNVREMVRAHRRNALVHIWQSPVLKHVAMELGTERVLLHQARSGLT